MMALRHKRTDQTGYAWSSSDLVSGQIGINTADGTVHILKSDNTVANIGGGSGGNPFDQDLNTTDNVTFQSVELELGVGTPGSGRLSVTANAITVVNFVDVQVNSVQPGLDEVFLMDFEPQGGDYTEKVNSLNPTSTGNVTINTTTYQYGTASADLDDTTTTHEGLTFASPLGVTAIGNTGAWTVDAWLRCEGEHLYQTNQRQTVISLVDSANNRVYRLGCRVNGSSVLPCAWVYDSTGTQMVELGTGMAAQFSTQTWEHVQWVFDSGSLSVIVGTNSSVLLTDDINYTSIGPWSWDWSVSDLRVLSGIQSDGQTNWLSWNGQIDNLRIRNTSNTFGTTGNFSYTQSTVQESKSRLEPEAFDFEIAAPLGNLSLGTGSSKNLDIDAGLVGGVRTGNVRIQGLTYPNIDGIAGQLLTTNGNGVIGWSYLPVPAGAIGIQAVTSGGEWASIFTPSTALVGEADSQTLSNKQLNTYTETNNLSNATTGTITINRATGAVQQIAPTGNITISGYSNMTGGNAVSSLTLIITQGATPRTITLPTGTAFRYAGNIRAVGNTANSVTMISVTAVTIGSNVTYLTTVSPEFV